MGSSSLQDKTVRPGSFKGMYYYSDRHKASQSAQAVETVAAKPKKRLHRKQILLVLFALIAIGGWYYKSSADQPGQSNVVQGGQESTKDSNEAVSVSVEKPTNYCADNSLDKFIRIGVEKRHLWACEGSKTVYDSAVITGLRGHPETETPVGTYKIYGKMTNTTLKGSDSRGAWSDPVYYWMPFLDNQYGTYGFHDATWRDKDIFGKISPDSEEASHGCVELPLTTSKWLYEWAPVGTTVTVES